ncbi:MAG: GIY-YIG nuclease family protein [Promethearchaeota archaeon]|jgi:hypothetical protein
MSRYQNGVIYKIVCNDSNIKDCYVGSCCNFNKRKSQHKSDCNNENGKSYNYRVYQTIRANGGWNNWSMLEVESYSCGTKRQLEARERHWLEELKANLNCQIPTRTRKEYQKEYKKEYQKTDKCKQYVKEYRKTDKYKQLQKEYQKNKYFARKLHEFIHS